MSEQPFRIFVVDDDPVAQMITVDQLDQPGYEVTTYDSGEDCLANLAQSPDLILMDVEMPGRSGIETCRAIREAGDSHAQVIFISSHDDLDTRLAAYDAGGDDFILKPFAPEELAQKARVAERAVEQRRGYAQQAAYAQTTAFTVMSSMGEMGAVLQFLRASFDCTSPDGVVRKLFDALEQYGLEGIVETRIALAPMCHSSRGACSPLESSLIAHARGMDRIFQFRDRLAINYPHVTLLIPNLPIDDPDRVGRLRDHLAILAEGVESRLVALDSERTRLAQAEGILRAVANLSRVLADIDRQQHENRLHTLEVANGYLEDLDKAFVHLGLTEAQEQHLIVLAKAAAERYSKIQDAGKSLGEHLQQVTGELQRMLGNQG